MVKKIVDEAARLLKDFPELGYYEAIEMARKMYERKEPTTDQGK